MEDKLQKTETINQLIDCYAGLFTERQQIILAMYYSDDYTLAEVAETFAISRQAVHDQVQRMVAHLEHNEEVLHLMQLNQAAGTIANDLQQLIEQISTKLNSEETTALRCFTEKIRLL
ncbi:MAG TPA: sigma factor-like helix-turn-helix DNA-binding protein [Bacillota bacterium]|nr:sigma factor-like helix-turn-helix DNA-binding protein [Bacillota bacterium]